MSHYDTPGRGSTAPAIMTPREAADYLRVGQRSLERWRHERRGPRWTRIGHQVRYRRADLDAYAAAHTVAPVAEGGQEGR
ncbi:hypothetical protein KBTX_03707 [wastewater metagenome]|uniref:Helix-turn-helix domain-containing protein n=3 Tax=root TaxID=1 RepID=A0A5B8RKC5_9ZZZZ|nr:hypothetical protein KBTEX_03707 [uncultured organism]